MNKKILFGDGNNAGWRGFNQAPLTFNNQRVEMIFIGLNIVRKMIKENDPDKCIMVWDGGLDPERTKLYPEYKNAPRRKELTEVEKKERQEFYRQMELLQNVFFRFGIEQYHLKEREADDVIFSLIARDRYAYRSVNKYIVVSTDKDFYQLLTEDDTQVYNSIKKILITRTVAEEELGIDLECYLDYRALTGDKSDNLPGIKGIGPTKAQWLVNHLLWKEIYNDDEIKKHKKLISLMSDNLKTFSLMKELIRFRFIEDKELDEGKSQYEFKNLAEFHELTMGELMVLGFQKALDNFMNFIAPFENLWRKSGFFREEK